ncbi:MAG TPA: hypothetical protein VIC34_06680 [Croceibacterium sp.]|jgi:hypothetical protein
MLRQLLTALAILTGLAATGVPAQASASDVAAVRLVETAELAVKCVIPSPGPAFAPQPLTPDGAKKPCPMPLPPVVLPPVMLKADRALE